MVSSVAGPAAPARPVPRPDERSQGFWDAAARQVLAVQRCDKCGWLSYPPGVICTRCLSPERSFRWEPVSGRGVVRSWTVVHTAFLPGFDPYVPYVVAVAELVEQSRLRFTARLAQGATPALRYGAAVETVFDDSGGVAVPLLSLVDV